MNSKLISEIEKVIIEWGRQNQGWHINLKKIKDLALAIAKVIEVKVPKKNSLPLELKHCVMEIYRKQQDLTPLLNQVRNDTIDEFLRLNPNIMKEE